MRAPLPAAGRWTVRWVLFAALWLVFTDTQNTQDVVAGLVAATIAATVSALVIRPGQPRTAANSVALLRIGPRRLLRPLAGLVADTGLVTTALVRRLSGRQVHGSFRAVRYRPDAPRRSSAGRAVTEIWGSLTPNRIVVGTDDDEGILLVHELVRRDEPLDPLGDS
jgi:multisubunit Na+/H+ antiporter MnhE subunit